MTYITTTPAAKPSRAAATPAGKSTTHIAARRGLDDPENRGRMAQVFEDYNEPNFHVEFSEALILGIWALAFLIAGAAFAAAPHILGLLFSLFGWLGL